VSRVGALITICLGCNQGPNAPGADLVRINSATPHGWPVLGRLAILQARFVAIAGAGRDQQSGSDQEARLDAGGVGHKAPAIAKRRKAFCSPQSRGASFSSSVGQQG